MKLVTHSFNYYLYLIIILIHTSVKLVTCLQISSPLKVGILIHTSVKLVTGSMFFGSELLAF